METVDLKALAQKVLGGNQLGNPVETGAVSGGNFGETSDGQNFQGETRTVEGYADHLAQVTREVMEAGAVPVWPVRWNQILTCDGCGRVPWCWAGRVLACPWCRIREAGSAVPRVVDGGGR